MAKAKKSKAKILLFDIETMANRAWVWGKYDQNVIAFDQNWYILCFAYKWLGQKKTQAVKLPDFNSYKKDPTDDSELCRALWDLFDEADIVIGHNSKAFDIKKANARFLVHGFRPPAPYKSVDTLTLARTHFKFDSNRLNDLAQYLGIGEKVPHEGFEMWLKAAVRGEKKAWNHMAKYNKKDVDLLEKVYLAIRPWIKRHPNLNLMQGTLVNCPNCGSSDLIKRGFYMTRVTRKQRYQCKNCGAYSHTPGPRQDGTPRIVR